MQNEKFKKTLWKSWWFGVRLSDAKEDEMILLFLINGWDKYRMLLLCLCDLAQYFPF